MELDLYFIREEVMKGSIDVNHVPATYQRINILTKPLSKKNFLRMKQDLKVTVASSSLTVIQKPQAQ